MQSKIIYLQNLFICFMFISYFAQYVSPGFIFTLLHCTTVFKSLISNVCFNLHIVDLQIRNHFLSTFCNNLYLSVTCCTQWMSNNHLLQIHLRYYQFHLHEGNILATLIKNKLNFFSELLSGKLFNSSTYAQSVIWFKLFLHLFLYITNLYKFDKVVNCMKICFFFSFQRKF